MLQFLLGLAVLPALAGLAAGLYGLWRAGGWLVDHSPIVPLWRHRPSATAVAAVAGTVVGTRSLWALNISRYVCVLVALGRTDQETAEAVRRGVYRELKPPVKLTRIPKEERSDG